MFTRPPIPTPSQWPTSARMATETASPSRAARVTIPPVTRDGSPSVVVVSVESARAPIAARAARTTA